MSGLVERRVTRYSPTLRAFSNSRFFQWSMLLRHSVIERQVVLIFSIMSLVTFKIMSLYWGGIRLVVSDESVPPKSIWSTFTRIGELVLLCGNGITPCSGVALMSLLSLFVFILKLVRVRVLAQNHWHELVYRWGFVLPSVPQPWTQPITPTHWMSRQFVFEVCYHRFTLNLTNDLCDGI